MIELAKIVETYEIDEENVKILTKTTETYNVDTEAEVREMIEEGMNSHEFKLVAHTEKFKPAKYKKEELIHDEYYVVTLKKEF